MYTCTIQYNTLEYNNILPGSGAADMDHDVALTQIALMLIGIRNNLVFHDALVFDPVPFGGPPWGPKHPPKIMEPQSFSQ